MLLDGHALSQTTATYLMQAANLPEPESAQRPAQALCRIVGFLLESSLFSPAQEDACGVQVRHLLTTIVCCFVVPFTQIVLKISPAPASVAIDLAQVINIKPTHTAESKHVDSRQTSVAHPLYIQAKPFFSDRSSPLEGLRARLDLRPSASAHSLHQSHSIMHARAVLCIQTIHNNCARELPVRPCVHCAGKNARTSFNRSHEGNIRQSISYRNKLSSQNMTSAGECSKRSKHKFHLLLRLTSPSSLPFHARHLSCLLSRSPRPHPQETLHLYSRRRHLLSPPKDKTNNLGMHAP